MSILATKTSIPYGENTTIIISDLHNISVTPNNSIENISYNGNETIFTVQPSISTIYYFRGYNSFNKPINLNMTIYITIISTDSIITTDYNTTTVLNVNGSLNYLWLPSLYLNQNTGSVVICTPLKNITYTIQGTDSFNTISLTYITVNINSNLIFNPPEPTIYDGNLLNLNVNCSLSTQNITYTWKSNLFNGLPSNCVDLKYGSEITIHPYNTVEYTVTAYSNSQILTVGYIQINVIPKPMNIIDTDILPYYLYNYIIERNKKQLEIELLKNKKLSFKIINFYYTTLQTAYRMEWTNKNGVSSKINWITYYQIQNKSNEMILSFEQQWRFFQYIHLFNRQNLNSNFGYLLNIVNNLYLEKPKKIPIYPMQPGVF
jgi:hypothetical protein